MRRAIPLLFSVLVILAACGGSSAPETLTVTAPASTEAVSTEAAPPVFYAGKASGLITPVRSLGEGWAKNGSLTTALVGKRGLFSTEQPKKRVAPLAKGITSIADQSFTIEDGLSTKSLEHTVIVFDSDEAARAALDAVPGVFTSLPSRHYVVKEVNPPLVLGEDARAVRGSLESDGVKFAVGLIAWRQANIVQVIEGRGWLNAPNALASRIAKAAYRQTEATLAG